MDRFLTLAISNFQDLTNKMEHTPYIENGPNIHPYFGSCRNTGAFQPVNNHEGLNRLASLHRNSTRFFTDDLVPGLNGRPYSSISNYKIIVSNIWMFPKIRDPPKSSILIMCSIINHPCWGYHYFWKHPYLTYPVIWKILGLGFSSTKYYREN